MELSFWLQAKDHTDLYIKCWGSDMKAPKAIIQLSHGMVEHIDRYRTFAEKLNKLGFIVYGDDHRGHGETGKRQGILGYFADQNGFDLLVDDMHTITKHIQTEHPGVPIFIYGHSMGSFITRNFIQQHSHEVTGVILSGTGSYPKLTATAGKTIAGFFPPKQQSFFMNNLIFGNYNNKIPLKKTTFDWLSRDEDAVEKYMRDPYAGYVPSAGFFFDLLSGILKMQMNNRQWIRKDLPLLFLSGDEDPVGNYGKGVFQAAELYNQAGLDNVKVMLFPGARHELHNEINKDEVIHLLNQWIIKQLGYKERTE